MRYDPLAGGLSSLVLTDGRTHGSTTPVQYAPLPAGARRVSWATLSWTSLQGEAIYVPRMSANALSRGLRPLPCQPLHPAQCHNQLVNDRGGRHPRPHQPCAPPDVQRRLVEGAATLDAPSEMFDQTSEGAVPALGVGGCLGSLRHPAAGSPPPMVPELLRADPWHGRTCGDSRRCGRSRSPGRE